MPWKFQEVKASRFKDSRHIKVVRLAALHTGLLYAQETFLVLISVRWWINSRAIVRQEGLCQWKNSKAIEPATFLLAAQCLSRQRRRVPQMRHAKSRIFNTLRRIQSNFQYEIEGDYHLKYVMVLGSFTFLMNFLRMSQWCRNMLVLVPNTKCDLFYF
jgi:hypothetical protein